MVTKLQTNLHTIKEIIPRIKKIEMQYEFAFDIEIHLYNGSKKLIMPVAEVRRHILLLKVLEQQRLVERKAENLDFTVLKCVSIEDDCPEYGGFNKSCTRHFLT